MASITFSNDEKTNLLIKSYLDKPSCVSTREYYEEPTISGKQGILPSQIWTDGVPDTAPSELLSLTEASLDDNGDVMKGSYAGKTSTDGTIRRFIKIPLEMIIGTAGLAYQSKSTTSSHPNGYADGITQTDYGTTGVYDRPFKNSIWFNYDPIGSYEIIPYKANENQLPYGSVGGNWLVDNAKGVLTFYEYADISGVDENNPPLVSFYSYVGTFGITGGGSGGGVAGVSGFPDGIEIDDECITGIPVLSFSSAVRFGTECNGSYRILCNGGGGDATKTAFRIQKRLNDEWITKFKFN